MTREPLPRQRLSWSLYARGLALSAMELDAALDRFWEAADAGRLGIDSIQVVADNGPHGERRRIAPSRTGPAA
jgi:hypothetical protein